MILYFNIIIPLLEIFYGLFKICYSKYEIQMKSIILKKKCGTDY
jgi:hypothetical protein